MNERPVLCSRLAGGAYPQLELDGNQTRNNMETWKQHNSLFVVLGQQSGRTETLDLLLRSTGHRKTVCGSCFFISNFPPFGQ